MRKINLNRIAKNAARTELKQLGEHVEKIKDFDKIREVLNALVKSGLVVQTKGQYHLAPDVKNEKIEKMLEQINAKLAQVRKAQAAAKPCILPRRLPVLR